MPSSAPVTVTARGVFQVAGANVRVVGPPLDVVTSDDVPAMYAGLGSPVSRLPRYAPELLYVRTWPVDRLVTSRLPFGSNRRPYAVVTPVAKVPGEVPSDPR